VEVRHLQAEIGEGYSDFLGDLLSPLAKAKRSLEEPVESTSSWDVFEENLLLEVEEPIRKDLRDLRDSIKENLSGLEKALKGRFCQNFSSVKELVSKLDEAFQEAPERAVWKLI
jgi:hypothetical protein